MIIRSILTVYKHTQLIDDYINLSLVRVCSIRDNTIIYMIFRIVSCCSTTLGNNRHYRNLFYILSYSVFVERFSRKRTRKPIIIFNDVLFLFFFIGYSYILYNNNNNMS